MPLVEEFTATPFVASKNTYCESLTDEAIDTLLDQVARALPGSSIGLDHYVHGAVCRAEAALAWVDGAWEALRRFSGGHVYANYMSVEGAAASRAAYGASYERLVSIKRKYDRENFFRLNANVDPR